MDVPLKWLLLIGIIYMLVVIMQCYFQEKRFRLNVDVNKNIMNLANLIPACI
jgi:hypothetical protein